MRFPGRAIAHVLLPVHFVFLLLTTFSSRISGVAGTGSTALGQFALDKILGDARDVFGVSSSGSSGGIVDEGYFSAADDEDEGEDEDKDNRDQEEREIIGRACEGYGAYDAYSGGGGDGSGRRSAAYNTYGHGHGYAYNKYARWMSQIPDDTPLAHLTIPGTHDAATWNYTQTTQDSLLNLTNTCAGGIIPKPARVYRCQRKSILDSLESGIRFFDLRFALDPLDAKLVFWHGPALLSVAAGIEEVLFGVYGWLEAHSSEVVILSFQYEGGTKVGAGSDEMVQRALFGALRSAVARRFVDGTRGRLGRLGDVRGKVVLFRRFDLDKLPPEYEAAMPGLHVGPKKWTDNSRGFELVYNETTSNSGIDGVFTDTGTAFIEDFYHPDNATTIAENIDAKFDAVEKHLRLAAGATGKEKDSLFVTFTSGTHVEIDPPVYPEIMALGSAGGLGVGDKSTPAVRGVNERLRDLLRELKGERLGVVVMDFFEEPGELIDLLLGF